MINRRQLVIIANNGSSTGNFLPGVQEDVENYLDFFRSNEGGAWDDSEIVPKHCGWTESDLIGHLSNCKTLGIDYCLIVFTGHGYFCNNSPVFELSSGNEVSLEKIKQAVWDCRCLMIADSCQKIHSVSENLMLSKSFSFSSSAYDRMLYVQAYNARLGQVTPHSFTFASAVSKDEEAIDTDRGGLYSSSLLAAASRIKSSSFLSRVWSIKDVHDLAIAGVRTGSNNRQHPQITTNSLHWPPFLIKL